MKSSIFLKSKKGNNYIYDQKLKRVQVCHPLLHYLIELNRKTIDISDWFINLKDESMIEIENCGQFSKKDVEYYYKKYLLLKENGYFTEIDQEKRLSSKLTAEIVKKLLANGKQVLFEVTEKCQMRCHYCGFGKFYHFYDKREGRNIDIGYAKNLLNYLMELWNSPLNTSHYKNIYITFYGGEPLLNFSFIKEIVNYVKQLKVLHNRFTFSMTTNGLLVEKYMDFLFENDFELLISMDGNEKNNAYRVFKNGKPTYNIIIRNIKSLQKKYPEYFFKRVNFIAVLQNRNSVSDILNFYKSHFRKIPLISELNTIGIEGSQKESFWKTYSNMKESLYQSEDYSLIEKDMFLNAPKIQNVSRFITYQSDFSFNNYKDLIYNDLEQERMPTGTCLPFSRKIFITVKGKILPCEKVGHQYTLGNVNDKKVELNFDEIAEKYNVYFNNVRKQCNVCRNAEACVQCIFNLNIEDNNLVCNGFMSENDSSRYLSSIINYIEEKPKMYQKILKEAFFE